MGVCCYCGVHEYKTLTIETCCRHLDQLWKLQMTMKQPSNCNYLFIFSTLVLIFLFTTCVFCFQPSPFQLSSIVFIQIGYISIDLNSWSCHALLAFISTFSFKKDGKLSGVINKRLKDKLCNVFNLLSILYIFHCTIVVCIVHASQLPNVRDFENCDKD
jgi:hypothetical protein